MGIFFSWADLAHSEGGLSLLGWLLGGLRLGMGIFFGSVDLAHSVSVPLDDQVDVTNSWTRFHAL